MLNRQKQESAKEEEDKFKEERQGQKMLIDKLRDEIEQLKDKLMAAEKEKKEADENREMLRMLYEKNIIDEKGRPYEDGGHES